MGQLELFSENVIAVQRELTDKAHAHLHIKLSEVEKSYDPFTTLTNIATELGLEVNGEFTLDSLAHIVLKELQRKRTSNIIILK